MIGRTLSHYRIVGQLGSGGMGVVYSAEDARLGRQVALKFVSADFAHDEQAILRLRSEARAASALNHPNICTIYDIGEADGHPFIVMELMKGQSLRDRLNSGPLKITQLVDIGSEIADALHAAHSEGIIHRDIKPGNVFLTERGHVKILDFGLAKLTSLLTSTTTTDPPPHTSATGVTHGTPAYMSPEQATGEILDGRTDLFSLGVVLYESATGHHPFPGKTSAVVLAGILDRAPASPLSHNPHLPVRLVEIISNCLEKDRELRYQSAADLRADLKRMRRDLDSGAVRSMERSGMGTTSFRSETPPSLAATAPVRHETPTPTDGVAGSAGSKPASKRGAVWMVVGIASVAAIIAAIAISTWPQRTAPPATVAAPAVASPAPASTESQVAAASASLKAGNYRAALAGAQAVLAVEPGNAAAATIRDAANATIGRFDDAVTEARRRLTAGEIEAAARSLESARAIDPGSPTVVELSARIGDASRAREAAARTAGRPLPADQGRIPAPQPAPSTPAPLPAPPAAAVTPVPPPPALPPPTVQPAPVEPVRPEPAARPEPPPPPVKETPAPPSAPAPAATGEAEDAAIRQVISTYARAIEGKDIGLFRSIKPNLTAEEERRLQEGFRAVTSQRVSLSVMSLERKGDRASAVVRRRDEIEAGGRKQTTDTRQMLTLARSGAGWVIVEIR